MAYIVNTKIENQTNGHLLDAKNVKGTYVVVDSIAERDALPSSTTVNGSLCYCTADSKFYQYKSGSWEEFSFGGNGQKELHYNIIRMDRINGDNGAILGSIEIRFYTVGDIVNIVENVGDVDSWMRRNYNLMINATFLLYAGDEQSYAGHVYLKNVMDHEYLTFIGHMQTRNLTEIEQITTYEIPFEYIYEKGYTHTHIDKYKL